MRKPIVKLSKGLSVPIAGAPASRIESATKPESFAVIGSDYVGLESKLLVAKGDKVSLGQPLFQSKRDPSVKFTAPASGTISDIHRGERRVLRSVVIEADNQDDPQIFTDSPGQNEMSTSELRKRLLDSGLWTAFRTRPFSRVPSSDSSPTSIFVTAIDTRPLSGDPELVVNENPDAFEFGLKIVAKLAGEKTFLCTGVNWNGPKGSPSAIEHIEFDGPHPAGLPGTHIHHLAPVSQKTNVWHIGYQDVIAIGKLFKEGILWTERVVAIGGLGFANPRLLRTRLGASLASIVAGELAPIEDGHRAARLISGCALSGRYARGAEAFLGRYHLQVTALPQLKPARWSAFRQHAESRFSFGNLLRRTNGAGKFSTDQNGRPTAMVTTDTFERLIPMDILATPLLKALLIKDTDQAQALGALELDEEDLALCSFICPGKNDYGLVLRRNLEAIEKDG